MLIFSTFSPLMLYLYIFGDNIEDSMGHINYAIFYTVCGLGASAFHIYSDPSSVIPAIGISGVISGVLGAYVMLYPSARVRAIVTGIIFWRIVRVPAFLFIGFWFILQILYVTMSDVSGVAYWAHIGGFIIGFLLIRLFAGKKINSNYIH